MKRVLFLLFLLLMIPGIVQAENGEGEKQFKEELQMGIEGQIQDLQMDDWDRLVQELPEESREVIGNMKIQDILRNLITGRYSFDIGKLFQNLGTYFFSEISVNLGLMVKVMVLAVICGILNNLRSSFENESIGEISHFVCYLLIIILIMQSFTAIIQHGRESIQTMVDFMQLIFPILVTLLVAMGGIVSSAVFQPAVVLLVSTISTFLKDVILPLILFSAVLVVINHMSEKIHLNKLAGLVRSACNWILGILFTVYLGVLTIQGATAASFDGISIRTAKYAINTFIPVVGGMFSDSVDTIISCSLLVKNAIGVVGLIVLALICVFSALKILAIAFIYRISASLLEPIGDSRVVQCLTEIANVLTILFVTVISVGVMFFITITLLIGAGNITVMMR